MDGDYPELSNLSAMSPVGRSVEEEGLTGEHRGRYQLLWERFIAEQLPASDLRALASQDPAFEDFVNRRVAERDRQPAPD